MNTQASQSIPVYVLNLARATDRRVSITNHLSRSGIQFEFIEAIDGNTLSPEELNTLLPEQNRYAPGVIGCYLSHLKAYKTIIDRKIEIALILEDDALLNDNFTTAIKNGLINTSFDFCLLDSDRVSENIPVYYDIDSKQIIFPGFYAYKTNVAPALLHAYLVTNQGAAKRLACALPIMKPIDIHTYLPIKLNILCMVSPKGANVSELSRQSYTSNRNETSQLPLGKLRNHTLFYKLRDTLKFEYIIGMLAIPKLKQCKLLDPKRRWRPMPPGRNIKL